MKVHGVPEAPGKLPFASVEQLETTEVPAKVKPMVEFASNPAPDAATRVPTTPLVGTRASPELRG